MEIPLIGLGTYKLLGKECEKVVELAIDIGYRHIDTAFVYDNHSAIANAIKGFRREELFLTSKFRIEDVDDHDITASVEAICDQALKELKTDYIDLLLIHWPDRSRALEEILAALEEMVSRGKLRSFGASNYTEHHLQDAYDAGLKVPYNQVELHPYLSQKKLLEFCQKNQTQLISYRSLGKGDLLKEPLFTEIGKNHGKTPTQVILRWITQQGVPAIPKASSEAHLRENLEIFDFDLSEDEVFKIDQLNRDHRYCVTEGNEFDY